MTESSFRQLKASIDRDYPRGFFVAIEEDRVLAAAADFQALEAELRSKGLDPRSVMAVEAGVEYPEYVTIFA